MQEVRPTGDMPADSAVDVPVYIPVEGVSPPNAPKQPPQLQRPFYDLITYAAFTVPTMFYVRISVIGFFLVALHKF